MEFKHEVENNFADIIQEYQFNLTKVNERNNVVTP